jgi:hypothetical protein
VHSFLFRKGKIFGVESDNEKRELELALAKQHKGDEPGLPVFVVI